MITGLTMVLGDESPGGVQVGFLLAYVGLGIGLCTVAGVHTVVVRAQRRRAARRAVDEPSSPGVSAAVGAGV